jgi:hypothetical protein
MPYIFFCGTIFAFAQNILKLKINKKIRCRAELGVRVPPGSEFRPMNSNCASGQNNFKVLTSPRRKDACRCRGAVCLLRVAPRRWRDVCVRMPAPCPRRWPASHGIGKTGLQNRSGPRPQLRPAPRRPPCRAHTDPPPPTGQQPTRLPTRIWWVRFSSSRADSPGPGLRPGSSDPCRAPTGPAGRSNLVASAVAVGPSHAAQCRARTGSHDDPEPLSRPVVADPFGTRRVRVAQEVGRTRRIGVG